MIDVASKQLLKPVKLVPIKKPKQKVIFADFSELDCHRDPKTGQVNLKEVEMCRYLEYRNMME